MAGKMKRLAPKFVFFGPYRSRNQVHDMAPKAMASWVMEDHNEIHFDLRTIKTVSLSGHEFEAEMVFTYSMDRLWVTGSKPPK
jgi:hypothetical protein